MFSLFSKNFNTKKGVLIRELFLLFCIILLSIQLFWEYKNIQNRYVSKEQIRLNEAVATENDATTAEKKQEANSSILYGKNVVCFGDSITFGQSSSSPDVSDNPWPQVLEELTGAHVVNMGICGSALAYDSIDTNSKLNRDSFVHRINNLDLSSYDYIFIAYGTNDLSYQIPIGENTDTEPYSFKGAINYSVDKLRNDYPDLHIVFVTPMLDHRLDESYINAIVEMSDIKDYEYIDMRCLGIKEDDFSDVYWDTMKSMHPNEATYYAMGAYISKYPDCNDHQCHYINFDTQGGYLLSKREIAVEGRKIGYLPITLKQGNEFDGWYTESGELITEDSIYDFDDDITLYAHFYSH